MWVFLYFSGLSNFYCAYILLGFERFLCLYLVHPHGSKSILVSFLYRLESWVVNPSCDQFFEFCKGFLMHKVCRVFLLLFSFGYGWHSLIAPFQRDFTYQTNNNKKINKTSAHIKCWTSNLPYWPHTWIKTTWRKDKLYSPILSSNTIMFELCIL